LSTLKLFRLFFLCVIISSCAQLKPFEDRRREPRTIGVYVGSSTPTAPVICYNPLWNGKDDTKALADNICKAHGEDSHAELIDTDYFSCRLFVPAKAYYKCVTDK
jgi:hypothetical protein